MPVGSKLRRLLQGQRQKISHHHSRLGLQMDPHPLPVLAESNSLQRRQIPGDPQEKRFHFCHPPSPKIILRIIMKSIDGGAQGTRSASEYIGVANRFSALLEFVAAASRGRLAVRGLRECEDMKRKAPYFLPYQVEWLRDGSPLKIGAKSRQVVMPCRAAHDSLKKSGRPGSRL